MPRVAFYWLPRVLAILFIGFVSIFALDVFQGDAAPLQIAIALAMHLIPSVVLLIVLIAAWRWEWIGAVFFGLAACLMLYMVWMRPLPFYQSSLDHKLLGSLIIAGPALLVASLFLTGWVMRRRLRA